MIVAVAFDGAVASDVAADVAVVHRIAAAANTLSLLQPTFVAVPFGARVVRFRCPLLVIKKYSIASD